MSLYKQLIVVIVALFTLMLAGVIWLDVDSTRRYLAEQLESHAQDTATSLGLSLSTHLKEADEASIVAMVDAVFDRGYYQQIVVDDMQGRHVVKRKLDVVVEGVPGWFVELLPLDSPTSSSLVMSGWRQVGHVYVTSHPGYAYQELWRSFIETAIWFFAIALLLLVLGGLSLRVLLRPLKSVEHQAEQLAKRHYEIQDKLPRTRELRSVVIAMNRLTGKLREIFAEQAETARHLRSIAYEDEVTGLYNRRMLEDELDTRLSSQTEFGHGSLLLLQIQGMKAFNDREGYTAGDQLLKKIAELLQASLGGMPHVTLARLGGGDLAAVLPGDVQAASHICDEVMQAFSREFTDTDVSINIGFVGFGPESDRAALLATADAALREAIAAGPDECATLSAEEEGESLPGRRELEARLADAIEQHGFTLFSQSVEYGNGEGLQQEVLVRLAGEDGALMTAGIFIPLAEELGLGKRLDQAVISQALALLETRPDIHSLALNVSIGSVTDRDFSDWFKVQAENYSNVVSRLCFELPEHSVINHVEGAGAFAEMVRTYGCRFGIDHFGRSGMEFSYLHLLQPEYVKIDATLSREIEKNAESQFLIRSLATIAHSLDSVVVAESVESEVQKRTMLTLGVDALQGYEIGRPQQFTN